MNIEGKNAVIDFMQQIEELERQKSEAKDKLKQKLKSLDISNSQEFIDWYYWETDNDVTLLGKILGVSHNTVVKRTTRPHLVKYQCRNCKQTKYHPCDSRGEATQFLSNLKNKRFKEKYYCEECKKELQRKQEEKQIKKVRAKVDKSRDKIHMLKTMPYDEYLLTKHWKSFKRMRIIEANFECTKCHRSDLNLHVHHLTYERRGCELPSDVMVLCEACHKEVHGISVPKHMIKNPVSLKDRALQVLNK